jgi:hypothetical protein
MHIVPVAAVAAGTEVEADFEVDGAVTPTLASKDSIRAKTSANRSRSGSMALGDITTILRLKLGGNERLFNRFWSDV